MAIKANMELNLHTLVLLDIRAHENRYMTANQALEYLLTVENKENSNIATEDSIVVVVARAGSDNPVVRADKNKKSCRYGLWRSSALFNDTVRSPFYGSRSIS